MSDGREWPECLKCAEGRLIPLSDYGRDGNGEISFGRAIGQSQK